MNHEMYRAAIVELEAHQGKTAAAIRALKQLVGDPIDEVVVERRVVRRASGKKTGTRALKGKRTNERTNERATRVPRQSAARSLPDDARQRLEVVPARDAAVIAALRNGPRASGALVAVLPKEQGQTPEQRESALRNAITRLRAKGFIKQVDEGWALTA